MQNEDLSELTLSIPWGCAQSSRLELGLWLNYGRKSGAMSRLELLPVRRIGLKLGRVLF